MSGKILAQLLVTGAQIFTKAFGMAYQQAVQNARSGGAPTAAKVMRGRMEVDEALQVLNFSKEELNPILAEKITERYAKMFKANDPAKGGSFYLQSKVFRAKESIDFELEEMRKRAK
mmetsp:Transcript_53978/g.123021  ORF Transcript_53978/g.123021 Transcript_53978/m.123021 type:complete len:117 (-) Transcript_53978:256-606(-)|eukprot:CAMPEP_0172588424 /NCGR_PEP_ID=MMETSP1068-20121228/7327_1 /TAXON_ID=35684 /ORGANISM="Pseudopedinella elastica, Strain CCMP716" /LENGTH=116 /DNA_ID=CAMNT_0013383739 /DNA_START=114 /DNA_END=464 /DNA_ORIENTATION=-